MGAKNSIASADIVNTYKPKSSYKIAIISSDNRDLKYIGIHKKNLTNYCYNNNYRFFFHTNEKPPDYDPDFDNFPVYWKKLAYVDYYLNHYENFDYVMWIDTDAFVMHNMKIESIIEQYKNPKLILYIARDNVGKENDNFNAGVFIVKNDQIGKGFIRECIDYLKTTCRKNGIYDLGTAWAGKCYEQGTMNTLIEAKYYNYTAEVPSYIINNTYIPNNNDTTKFIAHFMSVKDGIDEKIKHLA